MKTLIVICIIIFVVWYLIKSRKSKSKGAVVQSSSKSQITKDVTQQSVVIPEPKVIIEPKIEFSFSTGFNEVEPTYKEIAPNEWEVQTSYGGKFRLYNVPQADMEQLFSYLKNRFGSWRERTVPVEMIIHKTDLRCREIDAFQDMIQKELGILIKRREQQSDWNDLSELDKEDEILGVSSEYFDNLLEHPGCLVEDLISGLTSKSDSDAALIEFYGVEATTAYLRIASKSNNLVRVSADHYLRDDYELLVKKGMARKGKDIPVEEVLPTLTLKEMNELSKDLIEKPFTRKPKAIEFLVGQANLRELLSKIISFNQLFQALPLDPKFNDVNLVEIASSWRYDNALAMAIISGFDRRDIIYPEELRKDEAIAWRKANLLD